MRIAAFLNDSGAPLYMQTPEFTGFVDADGERSTAVLTFAANTSIANRVYTVRASVDSGETWLQEPFGMVIVPPASYTLPGDVTGSGEINFEDISLIRMYLAGHQVSINHAVADINGDGIITDADVSLLRMYLDGHPVAPGIVQPSDNTAISSVSGIVSISNETAAPGEYVDVVIRLDENEELSSIRLSIEYDSTVLSRVGVSLVGLMPMPMPPPLDGNPFVLGFDLDDSIAVTDITGNLATIRFRVLPGAAVGATPIRISVVSAYKIDNFVSVRLEFLSTDGVVYVGDENISLRNELISLINKAQDLLRDTDVSVDGYNVPAYRFWVTQNVHDNFYEAITEAILALTEYDNRTTNSNPLHLRTP